jgi:hypothetical protein
MFAESKIASAPAGQGFGDFEAASVKEGRVWVSHEENPNTVCSLLARFYHGEHALRTLQGTIPQLPGDGDAQTMPSLLIVEPQFSRRLDTADNSYSGGDSGKPPRRFDPEILPF